MMWLHRARAWGDFLVLFASFLFDSFSSFLFLSLLLSLYSHFFSVLFLLSFHLDPSPFLFLFLSPFFSVPFLFCLLPLLSSSSSVSFLFCLLPLLSPSSKNPLRLLALLFFLFFSFVYFSSLFCLPSSSCSFLLPLFFSLISPLLPPASSFSCLLFLASCFSWLFFSIFFCFLDFLFCPLPLFSRFYLFPLNSPCSRFLLLSSSLMY